MELKELLNKKLPDIPDEIDINNHDITFVPFNSKNKILENKELHQEAGFIKYENNYYVAMYCPMPNITKEMIDWWFWWHPQESIRYQIWYPTAHKNISYSKKDKEYFNSKNYLGFEDNIQYPKEEIASKTMQLQIDFMTPKEFGFDEDIMKDNNIVGIICGNVGIKGFLMHTKMCHILKQTDNGLVLISRFWMGELLKNNLLKKMVLNDETARGMTEHCCIEYRNLCEILPMLYKEYRK